MRKAAIFLSFALLFLTACGGEGQSEDLGLLEDASGIPEREILLTIGGREIPAWRYLYWLALTCDQIQSQYESAGLELDWSAPLEGGTLADYAKDQALADTALYATVESWAEEYGCALSPEDEEALEEIWTEKASSYGGETAYLAALARLGLNRDQARELSRTGRLYGKLYDLYCEVESPLAPDPESLDEFARKEGWVTFNRVLVNAGGDRENARQRAAELFAQINGAENPKATFISLASAGDDPAGPRTVRLGEEALESSLEDSLKALEPGQLSGVLESGEGFSILLRCETDPTAAKEDYFDAQLEEAAESALLQTTERYQSLDAAEFSVGLARARRALTHPEEGTEFSSP